MTIYDPKTGTFEFTGCKKINSYALAGMLSQTRFAIEQRHIYFDYEDVESPRYEIYATSFNNIGIAYIDHVLGGEVYACTYKDTGDLYEFIDHFAEIHGVPDPADLCYLLEDSRPVYVDLNCYYKYW